MPKYFFLLLSCLLGNHINSCAQTGEIFGPKGAVWLYENEGYDTTVKTIRIQRDSSQHRVGFDCQIGYVQILKISYLGKDSTVIYVNKPGYNTDSAKVTYHLPITGCNSSLYTFDTLQNIKSFVGCYNDDAGQFPPMRQWFCSYSSKITINGKQLIMMKESKDSSYKNDKCLSFCTPIIERIGSLGYMFPIYTCKKNYYAGRLISYYDPEFGYWKVPDSLRNLACSFKYINAEVEPTRYSNPNRFTLYPNPATDKVELSYELPRDVTTAKLIIYDLQGRVVYSGSIVDAEQEIELNTSDFKPGLYSVQTLGETIKLMIH